VPTVTLHFPVPAACQTNCASCTGVVSECCGVEGVQIPNVLYGRFGFGGVLTGDVTLTYNAAIINEAGTGTWTGTFTVSGHTVRVWHYCVPSLGVFTCKCFCDFDPDQEVLNMYAAFGSSAPGPPYDVAYDLYPVGAPDGTIDAQDLFVFYDNLEDDFFGSGGGDPSGTHCPNHSIFHTRVMTETNACVGATGEFYLLVQEMPFV
jgi:hypothetical protein